jgi:hypothetical protein
MGRCRVREIPGIDPARTADAIHCYRDATTQIAQDGYLYAVCDDHRDARWQLFVKMRWLYAIRPLPEPPRPRESRRFGLT